jgi:hypothetical protein
MLRRILQTPLRTQQPSHCIATALFDPNSNAVTLSLTCRAARASQPLSRSALLTVSYKQYYSTSAVSPNLLLLREACQSLLQLDSLQLDALCTLFGTHYIPREKYSRQELFDRNSQLVIHALSQELLKEEARRPLTAEEVFGHLRRVFDFLSAAKVGFLRGDLHTHTFYTLHKDLEGRQKDYLPEDFRSLLMKVTNPVEFRLPFRGIYRRELESKANLYQRQLLLEEVTSDQSHMHFEEVLDSLLKLNKVQEVTVVRRFMTEWVVPLTAAIKEEQSRCLGPHVAGKRKIYGPYLLKIHPEKIATTALAQLIICIFQEIYKQGSIDQFELQLFDGIE